MSIQEKLDALSPFVTTIRYSERPIVDIAFPPSWGLPESNSIEVTLLGDSTDDISRYMVYGVETEKVDVDALLDYMSVSIKLNKEREAKKTMLNDKIMELTTLFDKTALSKLKKLKFTFDEPTIPTISLGEIEEVEEVVEEPTFVEAVSGDTVEGGTQTWLDAGEDEEVRTHITNNGQKVDLPPKKKVPVPVEAHEAPACKCAAGEMCPECADI